MGNITRFALDYSRVTILFILFAAVFGTTVFLSYPKREDPSIVIREAVVTAAFPGMATQRVEDLITRKLEEKIREIPEVDEIRSDSKTGLSIVHVTVRDEIANLAAVWQDLRNKMNDIRGELPSGTKGPAVNDEFGLTAVATVALWADGFSLAEMREVARDLRDQLYGLDGIKRVELYGVQEERIYLEFSDARLSQFGVSPALIAQALVQQNIILPGGNVNVAGQKVAIEPSGNFRSVDDIRNVLVAIPGTERVVPLIDIATVTRGYVDPPDKPVFFNGKPAIVLSVSINDGVNSVEFGERLTRRLDAIENSLPIGYVLEYATYQPDLVDAAVDGAVNNLYQTLVIVLIVVVVFLGLRVGLIVGAFVPLTMLVSIIVMRLLDVELQRMSIASMIIALGLLVDNGIVVAEDIRNRIQKGDSARDAAVAGGKTLALPLLTSSLTTIFAFLPIVLQVGATGEYTLSLGQVLMTTLLASWFLAMFVTPALCAWFIKRPAARGGAKGPGEDLYSGRFYQIYRGFLQTVLRRRAVFIVAVAVAFVAAGYGFRFVAQEFFPPNDRNQYLVYLDLPAGTDIATTSDVVQRLGGWLKDSKQNPEVTSVIGYVGSGGPRFFLSLAPLDADPHVAFMLVSTDSNDQVPELVRRTRRYLLDHAPEARGRVKQLWFGGSETGLVEVRLVGPDGDVLTDKADGLVGALSAIPGTLDIKQDWENKVLKVNVEVDQSRARRAGLTSQDIANSLATFIDGAAVTDYREGDKVIEVIGRGAADERGNLFNLPQINVYSSLTGEAVPLTQIASFRPEWAFSRIRRADQERTLTVSAKHQYLKANQLIAELQPALASLELPAGYRWEMGGEVENSAEAMEKLLANVPLAGALIIALLVWQFNSYRRATIILATIPLSLIGVVVGLLVMNAVFGFMVILGLLSLAGIVINNGIVLIDRIDSARAEGQSLNEAIVNAAVTRFRPILMTTITTILGLLPLIVSRDPLFFGMAIAIAFGLAVATVITLGLVPVLYSILFRAKAA